jgi:hypothetical protein
MTQITCYNLVILQGLREILERYMEDDQDMYRMCLSKWRDAELENADAGSDNTLLIGGQMLYVMLLCMCWVSLKVCM